MFIIDDDDDDFIIRSILDPETSILDSRGAYLRNFIFLLLYYYYILFTINNNKIVYQFKILFNL